jgi:hypothetical protein
MEVMWGGRLWIEWSLKKTSLIWDVKHEIEGACKEKQEKME